MLRRVRVKVRGAVQGVGFRPFVHVLAGRLGLSGFVLNEPQGVEIELEGDAAAIDAFLQQVHNSPPPVARIRDIRTEEIAPCGEGEFTIRHSEHAGQRTVLVTPDLATCADCWREMRDPTDRRYRYPFINCTHCGPRYTIIRDLPYDRTRTTMAEFEMCPACRAEYEDPTNRRFHAEPTCCPACGPEVSLLDSAGIPMPCTDPIQEAVARLEQGQTVAVKGLGGFHLACDAANGEAVRALRRRKQRDFKPFALMVRDFAAVERICRIGNGASDPFGTLTGRERPILLLDKRPGHGIAEDVAPHSRSFGVMLPYTPLHHLLLEGRYRALVMTSGNLSDEPIAHTNEDAVSRLATLADCFLLHNRAIHIRTDDSVARPILGKLQFLRRSRGYAPFPIGLPTNTNGGEILAVGAELNNTICVTRENQAFLSHHIGDLDNAAAYEAFLQAVEHLKNMLAVTPRIVACDQHPAYPSTRYARRLGLPIVPVQHHHAHIASVLAETDRTDTVIGVSFDGLGWGSDGNLWGGEFLICDLDRFERVGHLAWAPQPGGDVSAKRPPRMAYVYLREAFGERAEALAGTLLPALSAEERLVIAQLIERKVNCPITSSMGRLFDAGSALLGICAYNSYHAQAPMELEATAWEAENETDFYGASIERDGSGAWVIRAADVIGKLVEDFTSGTDRSVCAARFHNSAARFTLEMCRRIRDNSARERQMLSTVALSGGVFANAFLLERLVPLLEEDSFEVLLNAETPAGDGGICLGQAAVAAWRRRESVGM